MIRRFLCVNFLQAKNIRREFAQYGFENAKTTLESAIVGGCAVKIFKIECRKTKRGEHFYKPSFRLEARQLAGKRRLSSSCDAFASHGSCFGWRAGFFGLLIGLLSPPIHSGGQEFPDERAEYLINDRLSFMRFLGPGLSDRIPDARTIWLVPGETAGIPAGGTDERAAVERHVRELDRLAEDLAVLDREIAQVAIDDPAVRRLITITGVNLTVAAGIVAAIGDISRFNSPQKLVSYFGLNPRVRQSGLGAAHHGRISKIGRSHARAMLVEAAWAAAKAPGPLHAFFVRIRARRGHQIAAVAVARKLTVPCWHLLTRSEDYLWARPALVANKTRAMELQAGHPQQKGSRRGAAYAYNVKALRDKEMLVAAQAERSYEHFVAQWKPRRPKEPARGRLSSAGHK